MLVKVHTAYGTFWKQTELAELIREVDAYRGKPNPKIVRKLAEKYGDTEEYVWSLFRTRRFRKGKKWRSLGTEPEKPYRVASETKRTCGSKRRSNSCEPIGTI